MARIGRYLLAISLLLLPGFCRAQVSQKPLPGQDLNNTWTGNNTFTGQLNCKSVSANVKCVDSSNTQGWTGSDPGAWINAADTAIGAGTMGEIWYFGGGTATTQVSIGDEHSLKIFNTLNITNPILVGKWSHLGCLLNGGSSVSTVCLVAANNMAQMVRMRVQDGSLETFTFDNAQLGGGAFTFSRGVVDLTGMNDVGIVGNLTITNYSGSSPCVYVDDLATANAGSGHSVLGQIWCTPNSGNTATGVLIKHTNTAGGTPLGPWHFQWIEIQTSGATLGGASGWFTVQNLCTVTCGSNPWQFLGGIEVDHLEVDNFAVATDAVRVDGCMGCVIHNLYSFGGSGNLIHQTNSANNFGNRVENIFSTSSGVSVLDDLASPVFSSGSGLVKNAGRWDGAPQSANTGYNSWDLRYAYGNCIEQSALPPGLGGGGYDALWCDSAHHAWAMNINGSTGPEFAATGFSIPEGSTFGLGGQNNSDNCTADSTAHALKCSYNNGPFLTISQVIPVSFTTTAVASEVVTVTGMTASGHCSLTATNSGAASGIASFFLDTYTTNAVTFHHTATAGWTVNLLCTPN